MNWLNPESKSNPTRRKEKNEILATDAAQSTANQRHVTQGEAAQQNKKAMHREAQWKSARREEAKHSTSKPSEADQSKRPENIVGQKI